MPTLGEQLKALRVKAGKTQEQLATELHTSKAAISRYEKDQRQPRREQLTEIARVLGANPDELFRLLFATPSEFSGDNCANWEDYMQYLIDFVRREWPELSRLAEVREIDDWITDLSSPFVNYEDGSEQLEIVKSLIKILVDLDLKWQRELLNDAKTYIDIQNKKSEKTRMLEQQEE